MLWFFEGNAEIALYYNFLFISPPSIMGPSACKQKKYNHYNPPPPSPCGFCYYFFNSKAESVTDMN